MGKTVVISFELFMKRTGLVGMLYLKTLIEVFSTFIFISLSKLTPKKRKNINFLIYFILIIGKYIFKY